MTLTGLYVPLITPFDAAGAVALDALAALADDLLAAGATGLVALGTTGEPSALDPAERRAVVEVAAAACRRRAAPLLVGADTPAALRELAARPEVVAALCLVPPFVRPGEDGVVATFAALAEAAPLPLVVYDVPARTGQRLSAAALRRLAALPGVVGTKHAPGGIGAETVALLADPPREFAVLGGDDVVVSPLLAMGAHGGILASAHVATASFVDLVAAWLAGDATRAMALGRRLAQLSAALFAGPNPTVIKAVLHAQGRIPTPAVRLPLLPATAACTTAALRHLDGLSSSAEGAQPLGNDRRDCMSP